MPEIEVRGDLLWVSTRALNRWPRSHWDRHDFHPAELHAATHRNDKIVTLQALRSHIQALAGEMYREQLTELPCALLEDDASLRRTRVAQGALSPSASVKRRSL